MSPTTQHPDYICTLPSWSRARDVLAGEDAVKRAGERYLPRLDDATDEEYSAYKKRASFFNATARTAEGYAGLIFRRSPQVTLPTGRSQLARAMAAGANNLDLRGATLTAYARLITEEVIAVGRAGTLVDWSTEESRAYAVPYRAEQIVNWRVERIRGRNVPTLIVLREPQSVVDPENPFATSVVEQYRVLRLVSGRDRALQCAVEIWRETSGEWFLAEKHTPTRAGRALTAIPFVFHGPRHSNPNIDKLPLADLIAVNLSHYRLNADYRHGMHYTALPTVWVAGFDATQSLKIGASTAWVTDNTLARAGFLEFQGQGLATFERAMDRDERLLAMLGSRMLEPRKNVGETAEAIELRQSGESSVLGALGASVSESLTQVLRWLYWWHSGAATPEDVTPAQASIILNNDFTTRAMEPQALRELVSAWTNGAITEEQLHAALRRGEVLNPNIHPAPGILEEV